MKTSVEASKDQQTNGWIEDWSEHNMEFICYNLLVHDCSLLVLYGINKKKILQNLDFLMLAMHPKPLDKAFKVSEMFMSWRLLV